MVWLWIGLGLLSVVLSFVISVTLVCYYRMFHSKPRTPLAEDEYAIPEGEIYEAFREDMIGWTKMIRAYPYKEYSIRSFDGLTLRAKLFEYKPGAPIELMFHGYRGNAERDLCGGVQRCFALGRSALIVDERACGRSGGNVITFGINEHRDCLAWLDYAIQRFGPEAKFILTGISMGASTVLMAAGNPLPENVIGVLADCGFTTARDIIKKVIRQMKLPADLAYPFVKLGAKLYGHFDLEEVTALDAVKKCTVPVIIFHGEADDFVPCDMGRELYAACASRKRLVTVPGAGHGLSCLVAKAEYLTALREFFGTGDTCPTGGK